MGARLLRRWLSQPLLDQEEIEQRQQAIQGLLDQPIATVELAGLLGELADLERLAGRAFQGRLGPRDCLALSAGLTLVPRLSALLASFQAPLDQLELDSVDEVGTLVPRYLVDEPPAALGPGVIRAGLSEELDELRALGGDTRRW